MQTDCASSIVVVSIGPSPFPECKVRASWRCLDVSYASPSEPCLAMMLVLRGVGSSVTEQERWGSIICESC